MDDMMDAMTGDVLLGRRLGAYAETRLSPDLQTSSRLRARVLAVAHRRAARAGGDAGLTVLSRPAGSVAKPFIGRPRAAARASRSGPAKRWRRVGGALLAASLSAAVLAGGTFAARPNGPLYDARIWVETLTLPSDPSARAVAELARLEERLREAADAGRAGDTAGVTAALAAYESIVTEASTSAILAGDEVASAVIATGVARNVEVLRGLLGDAPAKASAAISRALDAAIARSTDTVDRMGTSPTPNGGGSGAGPGQPAAGPSPKPTKEPVAKPTAKPTAVPTAKPAVRPTAVPTAKPTAMPTPTHPNGDDGSKPPKSPKLGRSNPDN